MSSRLTLNRQSLKKEITLSCAGGPDQSPSPHPRSLGTSTVRVENRNCRWDHMISAELLPRFRDISPAIPWNQIYTFTVLNNLFFHLSTPKPISACFSSPTKSVYHIHIRPHLPQTSSAQTNQVNTGCGRSQTHFQSSIHETTRLPSSHFHCGCPKLEEFSTEGFQKTRISLSMHRNKFRTIPAYSTSLSIFVPHTDFTNIRDYPELVPVAKQEQIISWEKSEVRKYIMQMYASQYLPHTSKFSRQIFQNQLAGGGSANMKAF